jgi:hypothetical protein
MSKYSAEENTKTHMQALTSSSKGKKSKRAKISQSENTSVPQLHNLANEREKRNPPTTDPPQI